ncbi:MAG TPA: RIP metalloprotease RseP [Salinivirgaceae bacterium]|nr:RIP metalloprotease RseP [Salinivirgaceae bacterium]
MEILIKISQLLLSLSILIILHEFGHFIFAKIFKTRVEKFYLFFNPWFSLYKKKIGETIFGIGWIPLGGYVKISGMIDESLDKEQLQSEPQPYEFRAKPSWQRLLIMVGGVLLNFVLALLIYIMVLFAWGEQYIPLAKMEHGIVPDSTAELIGFKAGDRILGIDGKPIERFQEIISTIILNNAQSVEVIRGNDSISIEIPEWVTQRVVKNNDILFSPRLKMIVGGFSENSPAQNAGLKENDHILMVDSIPTPYLDLMIPTLEERKNQRVQLTVKRDNDTLLFDVVVSENGKIGVYADMAASIPLATSNYGFFESIPAGIAKGFKTANDYLKQLKLIFSPKTKAYESLGGFITIGKIFPGTWDWQHFWNLTAFLSIMLAILNLLPIPALDGGHVMFLLYEMISGRKPSEKFMEYAQIAGMIFLLLLIIYANGNDIIRLFR